MCSRRKSAPHGVPNAKSAKDGTISNPAARSHHGEAPHNLTEEDAEKEVLQEDVRQAEVIHEEDPKVEEVAIPDTLSRQSPTR